MFVDPIDGSAELGSGGSQFSVAITKYAPGGIPIFSAVACPGMRPVFKDKNNSFSGFDKTIGTVLYGSPEGVFLLPMFDDNNVAKPLRVEPPCAIKPNSSQYSSVNLDLNLPSACGLGKHIEGVSTALCRMQFSNIYAQCQVIMGHANATTFGPSQNVPTSRQSGIGISGSKAWDVILPLIQGVGLIAKRESGGIVTHMTPDDCLDSYVLRDRIVVAHKDVIEQYETEIITLRNKIGCKR